MRFSRNRRNSSQNWGEPRKAAPNQTFYKCCLITPTLEVVGSNPVSRTKTEDFLLKILGFQCHMSSCCGCQFSFSSLVVVNTSGTSSDFNAGLHGAAGLTLVLVKGMAVDVQGSGRLRVSEKPRHGCYIRSACDQKACVCMGYSPICTLSSHP